MKNDPFEQNNIATVNAELVAKLQKKLNAWKKETKECYIAPEGVSLADTIYNDGACVTRSVGSYQSNSLGLYDMHGNAAEWTLTDFNSVEKTVKGGSFLDRPERADVNVRHGFSAWQNVHNVGFRIVINE